MEGANDQSKDYVIPGGSHGHNEHGQQLPAHRKHVKTHDQYTHVTETSHGHHPHQDHHNHGIHK